MAQAEGWTEFKALSVTRKIKILPASLSPFPAGYYFLSPRLKGASKAQAPTPRE